MTKTVFIRGITFGLLVLATSGLVADEIILEEDFEGYESEAELNATWQKVGNALTRLDTDPETAGNTTLYSKGDRRHRTFTSFQPTNDEPLYLRVDYYDDYQPDVPGREYIGLWGSAFEHGNRLIEVGLHNNADGNSTSRYTARVFGSEHGVGWFDLESTRKMGWRQIELWIFADTVEIYLDGELDAVVGWTGGEIGAVRLGFGAGNEDTASLTGVHYDNLSIKRVVVPGGKGTLIELSGLFRDSQSSSDPEPLF